MIRPEAKKTLWRWREIIWAVGVIGLGLYWAGAFVGLLHYIGWVVVLIGIALGIMGIQRGRFRTASNGAGVVTVIEGQITYFGPISGGAVAIDDITKISLDQHGGAKVWVIDQPAHPSLIIPIDAKGSDQLFDAFTLLAGLRIENMLHKLSQEITGPVLIWQSNTYLQRNSYLQ